ncbi:MULTISPECIES: MFS transporter [Paenibacillus]|uniref:MFS transporter n=1 Tax=Paenibacillus arenosi TaxID=2774142 RepID=A0ABR9B078_9BACL|nr:MULTISPECIES: MFS transporter [Paenibacillus]MBD8499798.1 MFS transporter [Paenibacillus arenosi]
MNNTRNIVLFSISRLLSELMTSMFKFALSLYILDITGSASMFSIVLACMYIPSVIVDIFAGVYIDRSDKKKVLVMCDLLSGVAILLFLVAFQFYPTHIGLFIGYALVLSTLQALFSLGVSASVPLLVSADRVSAVNSSNQSINALLNIAGPIVGAVAYSIMDLGTILLVNGIAFIASGIVNIFLVFKKSQAAEEHKKPYWDSLKEVYQYIYQRSAIKYLLGVFIVTNFIIAPAMGLVLPFIIYQELKMSAHQLAFIEAAASAGLIIGAILISLRKLSTFISNKIFVLFQLQAVALVLWAFPKLPFVDIQATGWITFGYIIILASTGMLMSMGNIPMVSYVQLYVPDHIRASIFGVVSTVTTISVPIGMWIYGLLLEQVDFSYFMIGSSLILFVVGYMAHRNKSLRDFFKATHEESKLASSEAASSKEV